jgi:hypothetical protein
MSGPKVWAIALVVVAELDVDRRVRADHHVERDAVVGRTEVGCSR